MFVSAVAGVDVTGEVDSKVVVMAVAGLSAVLCVVRSCRAASSAM